MVLKFKVDKKQGDSLHLVFVVLRAILCVCHNKNLEAKKVNPSNLSGVGIVLATTVCEKRKEETESG